MSLRIVCSGHLVRHPLGGHCWHHLQYLVGFARMGHKVTFFEDHGWPLSCYDPSLGNMTDDPEYGLAFLKRLLAPHGLENDWCYLAADGAAHGLSREELAQRLRECDIYFNLSNVNCIPEIELCRRRALVDTDPVFTQIGGFGMDQWERYNVLFTYGENVHRSGSTMPSGGARWLPTRQPVVLDLWPQTDPPADGPITTVMNWSAYGDCMHNGRAYGQKDWEFEKVFDLPQHVRPTMRVATTPPEPARQRLIAGGWEIDDPLAATYTPDAYQQYLAGSRAEFCVAKHGYVSTHCGWFSDRSCGYLASGRPVVVQDTGFSDFLPCGKGLLAWRTRDQAIAGIQSLESDYAGHCRAARAIVGECFEAPRVLGDLLSGALA